MSYFVLMGRRIPKQAITGFRFQNETDNIRPFLSIRIRGKEEIIPFKDKKGDTVRESAFVLCLLQICENR
jgi:hypothetical protein